MPNSKLFISHKHSDRKIAEIIGTFIRERSSGTVKVHLSSSPDFQGPKFGQNLNAQLRKTLWETDALILVYTSEEQDWQYCMWECGVATHPASADSKIVVFQCGSDIPVAFRDVLRVNVRNEEDIKRFANEFLHDPTFFPNRNGAIAADLEAPFVDRAAKQLYNDLEKVLPTLPDGLGEEWSAWPYLTIELPRSEIERLEQAGVDERMMLSRQIVSDHGLVIDSDARAARLFGQAGIPSRMRFESLLRSWKRAYPSEETTWFDSCCEQIMTGAIRGFPVIRWTPLIEVGGEATYTAVLSRIRRVPFAASVQFDVYFYNLSDPRAVPVTSRMIRLTDFYYKNLGQIDPRTLKLKDLVAEIELRGLNRIPIFDGELHPMYIVHRSMIDKFIVKQVLSAPGGGNPNDLSLADLLADADMKRMFESTFVVVKRQAVIADATSAMRASPGCSDIFVTEGGGRNEPVEGWLTNVDIAQGG